MQHTNGVLQNHYYDRISHELSLRYIKKQRYERRHCLIVKLRYIFFFTKHNPESIRTAQRQTYNI